jgi:sec-independent protein translocase protein TatA
MNPVFAMLNTPEVIAILALALIIFGAKKLPELARGLGQGIREFKKSSREITDEIQSAVDVDSPPPAPKRIEQNTVSRAGDSVDVTQLKEHEKVVVSPTATASTSTGEHKA